MQDGIFDRMDEGSVHLNQGCNDLSTPATIRLTCSRGGAVGKDQFDLSGVIAKWARDGGEHVMRCATPLHPDIQA